VVVDRSSRRILSVRFRGRGRGKTDRSPHPPPKRGDLAAKGKRHSHRAPASQSKPARRDERDLTASRQRIRTCPACAARSRSWPSSGLGCLAVCDRIVPGLGHREVQLCSGSSPIVRNILFRPPTVGLSTSSHSTADNHRSRAGRMGMAEAQPLRGFLGALRHRPQLLSTD
jgi:hypothetical protein